MAKRLKTFQINFTDPSKTFYCGGDTVSGRITVEVNEVTRVSAMKVLGLGCAKVEYAKGKQRCRQEAEYLRHEEVLRLDDQPTGTVNFSQYHPLQQHNTSQLCYLLQLGNICQCNLHEETLDNLIFHWF